ncbi:hypothetical protein ADL27_45830, partial [Streptomyces sp. NRRL F-6602]
MEPQVVVEHCLAANSIRRARDTRLTLITVLFGVLFLPGLLLYLGVFGLRRSVADSTNRRAGLLVTPLLIALGVLGVLFLL